MTQLRRFAVGLGLVCGVASVSAACGSEREATDCEACLASGGTWQPSVSDPCTQDCGVADTSCFTNECPGACSADACENCFGEDCLDVGCVQPPGVFTASCVAFECFSPTLAAERALTDPEAGCPCTDEPDVCVEATANGAQVQIALVCDAGRWTSVVDGPCAMTAANGSACEVAGDTYDSRQIAPDPFSCNHCVCQGGELVACSDADCPLDCPDGTAPGSDCAQCGPTDACEIVRTDCLPSCDADEDCVGTSGFTCIDGVCLNVCG